MTKKTDIEKPLDTPPPVNASAPPPDDGTQPPVDTPPADDETAADGDDMSALDVSLADINAELEEAEQLMAGVNARKAALVARRDAMIEARDANRDPHSNTLEIRRYLDSQQAAREARGEQWRRVREAGVDIKALMPQKPPIDQRPARPRGGPRS